MSKIVHDEREKIVVFISYSHDNDDHKARVRTLADSLKELRLTVLFDQYEPDPPDGWALWIERGIARATHVLLVCTEEYLKRMNREAGAGGVRFEGTIIRNLIYASDGPPSKFIPVLIGSGSRPNHIPITLQDRNRYIVTDFKSNDRGFQALAEHLTDLSTLEIAADPTKTASGSPRRLAFRIFPTPSHGYMVQLATEGQAPAEASFDGNPLGEPTTVQHCQAIDAGTDSEDDLAFVGTMLWRGLITGKVGELFKKIKQDARSDDRLFHLQLTLDPDLESLPWEAMHDPGAGFLASQKRFCVTRCGSSEFESAAPLPGESRKLAILLVLPAGSGLDFAPERSALMRRTEPLAAAIEMVTLDGTVTLEGLGEVIDSRAWDIVHFAGHGRETERGGFEFQLNDPQGRPEWVSKERFATLFNQRNVRLAFLNCCRGTSVRSDRIAALGPLLLNRGVAAVIGMRYEIKDSEAHKFADEFYRVLLTGRTPGRADIAVEAARVALFRQQNPSGSSRRGFVTPTLYLAPGGEEIFPAGWVRIAGPPAPEPPVAVIPPARNSEIPVQLLKAIRERRCIPVIGPGLLMTGVRNKLPPPGPRALARILADASAYPALNDFDIVERAGEWLEGWLLRRVSQHFLSNQDIQHELFERIEKAFGPCEPTPPLLDITRWQVPGYICLYIDALLERALRERERSFVALTLSAETPSARDVSRLVHLCGTWDKSDSDDFTLSEQQHDQLWDKLAKLPPWLSDLVHAESGRSLLILGAHPNDPLVRRLVAKLLDPKVSLRTGPIFFPNSGCSQVDRAYWTTQKVHWIDETPAAVISAINAILTPSVGGA
jgi:hypothetical protein